MVNSEAILGAGGELGHATQASVSLNDSQKARFLDKTMTFYVYGRISYTDVFGADHETEYLYFLQELAGAPHKVLSAYPTGNKAK